MGILAENRNKDFVPSCFGIFEKIKLSIEHQKSAVPC